MHKTSLTLEDLLAYRIKIEFCNKRALGKGFETILYASTLVSNFLCSFTVTTLSGILHAGVLDALKAVFTAAALKG
jgi:hypothetical protein